MAINLQKVWSTFQRFIDHILHGLDFVCVDIDDVLVSSYSVGENMYHRKIIYGRFEKYGIVIDKMTKQHTCIEEADISIFSRNTEAIIQFAVPTYMKSLRQFFGRVNFYRCFIPKRANITQPLTSNKYKEI